MGTMEMFKVGQIYNRLKDIHEPYGGQRQGGISTPKHQPLIFLFTGQSGEQYGYSDGWNEDGVFLYTGEGQRGDMEFRGGNKAIRDHSQNAKDLHLLESLGKGKGYRYIGLFGCPTWEFRQGLDAEKNLRQVIVFHLIEMTNISSDNIEASGLATNTLEELRQLASESALSATSNSPAESSRLYYKRSSAVRNYVLARAEGKCESCDSSAPFRRKDNSLYLEPHHTRKVSDSGPDHPRWVGAICPNCHREIHYGTKGEDKNHRLQKRLKKLEE